VTVLQILGKAEFLNPGGSVKDRVALRILQEALVSSAHLSANSLLLVSPSSSGPTAERFVRREAYQEHRL
jgi:cysteine synthase A